MNNKFKELLEKFKELNLPGGEYAIYGSGPLGVRDIRDVNDLDIIVTDSLYQELKNKYNKDPEKERIKVGEIEIYPIWVWGPEFDGLEDSIKEAEIIDGLKFVNLSHLLKWKEKMGRPKDLKDIELINQYLKK